MVGEQVVAGIICEGPWVNPRAFLFWCTTARVLAARGKYFGMWSMDMLPSMCNGRHKNISRSRRWVECEVGVKIAKKSASGDKHGLHAMRDEFGAVKTRLDRVQENLSTLTVHVVKNNEVMAHMVTKDDLDELKGETCAGQDKIMVVLERLDQERHFTFVAVQRLDKAQKKLDYDVKSHLQEIDRIKEFLKV